MDRSFRFESPTLVLDLDRCWVRVRLFEVVSGSEVTEENSSLSLCGGGVVVSVVGLVAFLTLSHLAFSSRSSESMA